MKPTSNPRMVLDHDSAAIAVFMANLFNTEFSNIVPDECVVYTLGLDANNPHIEEMILVHLDEETHSGVLITIEGETVEFDDDCFLYGSLEEAEAALDLINAHNQMVLAKKLAFKAIREADKIIKEIDDLIGMMDDPAGIIALVILRGIMCNEKKTLFHNIHQADKIIRVTKGLILEH